LVVAVAPVPKKSPVYCEIWNDVDMNCCSTPFTPCAAFCALLTRTATALTSVNPSVSVCPASVTETLGE